MPGRGVMPPNKNMRRGQPMRLSVSASVFTAFILLSGHPPGAFAQTNAKCSIAAFSIDKDPNGLNVRAGPGTKYKVLARLKRVSDAGYEIYPEMEVLESRGNWLRMTRAIEGLDAKVLFNGTGWVHNSLMATTTRGYDVGHVQLRASPNAGSAPVMTVPRETEVGLRGCKGDWVFVDYKGRRGWLGPSDHCGTAATTCN